MRMYDLIQKKRLRQSLTSQELQFLVSGAVSGKIPDYQLSAWLMAVCINGMTPAETAALTMAMAQSGDRNDFSALHGHKIDKHSTGGVGDKTTLTAVPIAAACGVLCPKMSGRGLGYTGGTADKLEAIPGFRTNLTEAEFFDTVRRTGMSLMTQTGSIAPADKKLYALRDVTATVDSIPLIASSIMSKKLASGCDGVVLDVKAGSGAFMKDRNSAKQLADQMISIGEAAGIKVSAFISNMDVPLGNTVGNAIEVEEAMDTLRGGGPADFRDHCIRIAAEMIRLAFGGTPETCRAHALKALNSGAAFETFSRMVECQGGDPRTLEKPFPLAPFHIEIMAPRSGIITHMQTDEIGAAAVMLGAGRSREGEKIDMGAGIRIHAKTGDRVEKNQPLAVIYTSHKELLIPVSDRYLGALSIGEV